MHTRILLSALAVLTSASFATAQSPATKVAPQKGWLNNVAAAKTQAQKSGKPLMVVFRCDP